MSAALAHVQTVAPVTGGPLGALQRQCDCGGGGDHECEDCKKKNRLQRRPSAGAAQGLAPGIVHEVLHTPGQPLDPATLLFMESRFGHDFGRVRVHTGAKASDSALAVDALAYTVGRDVVFREGHYRPEMEEGKKILAHELTHVVQQGAAGPSSRATGPRVDISHPDGATLRRQNPPYPGVISYCRSIGVPCPAPHFHHGTVCRLVHCVRAATANLPFAISPGICIYQCLDGRICTCVLLGTSTSATCVLTLCDSPGQAAAEPDFDALTARAVAAAEQHFAGGAPSEGASAAAEPASLQAKLEVGAPGDRYEREAERLSEAMVRAPDPPRPILTSRPGPALQRYEVPSNLPCRDVVGWLNRNSSYKPEWAQTACDYSFNGQVSVSPPRKVGKDVQVTVKGGKSLSVDVDCPVDRPEWSPSPRPNGGAERAAWIRMRAVLDKHERDHQAIGGKFKPIIEKQFQRVNFAVVGTDAADATAKAEAKLQEEQRKWVGAAQKAQNKIDPFRDAVLRCPPESTELEEFAPAPEYIGPSTIPAQPATLEGPDQTKKAAPSGEPTLSPELQELFPP